jgi:hypothetical protein
MKRDRTQIASISVRHDAIIDWLIMNPASKLGETATHFRVTQTWLSLIIHSDIFKAEFARRKGDLLHPVFISLRDKLETVAHQAIDRISDDLAIRTDPDFALKTAKDVLSRIGYAPTPAVGPSGPRNTQVNFYGEVSASTINAARELFGRAERLAPALIEGEAEDEPCAITPG